MATIGVLSLALRANTTGFNKGFRTANRTVDGFVGKMRGVGSVVRGLIGPLAALGGAAGIGMVVRNSIKAASAAEEVANKFAVVFGNEAQAAQQWAQEYAAATGFATTETKRWMSSLQDTFVPLGYSRKAASKMSEELVALVGDIASFNDANPTDVLRDIQSAIVGQHETMRKYGVIIQETTMQEFALANGIATGTGKLTDQQKVMARLGMITAGTKDAQGDLLRTQDSFANRMRRFKGGVTELAETFGKSLMPMAAKALGTIDNWVRQLTRGAQAMGFAFENWSLVVQVALHKVGNAISLLVERTRWGFFEAMPAVLIWAQDNWKTILSDMSMTLDTYWQNFMGNLEGLYMAGSLEDWLAGDVQWKDVWTPLGEGLETELRALPNIPEFVRSQAGKATAAAADSLAEQLAARWKDFEAGKFMLDMAPEAANALNAVAEAFKSPGAFEKGSREAYSISLQPQLRSAEAHFKDAQKVREKQLAAQMEANDLLARGQMVQLALATF